ncbi:MAG: family 78 glycoside hydrolase catalytic domain, partial [Phycisphaerae bacterium]
LGGLIAWGTASDDAGDTVPIATNETWRALGSPAHRPDTPALSFALNPAELLDARALPEGWAQSGFDDASWPNAVVCGHADHWGPLRPRSIPLLNEGAIAPHERLGTWAARRDGGEDVYSFIVASPGGRTRRRVAAMAYIHSPRSREITFGAWWGRYWINGRELAPRPREDVSLRQDFTAALEAGWNLLEVQETMRHGWWDFHLALPADAGLSVSAEREIGSPHTFLIGGPWVDEAAKAADAMDMPLGDPSVLPTELGPWLHWPREKGAESPCRERAWKSFERISDEASLRVDIPELAEKVANDTLSLLLDFGGEVLGRPVVDFTAAAGTVVDLTYTERLKADGTADVHGRHFVDLADRYIARGGRQTWHVFHPRGLRYLELLIGGDLSAFELHNVALTRAGYPVEDVGSFECSDAVLNDIWAMGRATLRACMEDAYLDCPWRERGLYAGDFLVQFSSNLAAYGDTALFRRCIELFLLGQGDNGLVPAGAHGLPAGRHPDYSAIIPQALWHYWARTGDEGFLRESLPRLEKLVAGLDALRADGADLLDGTELQPYIDLSHMDKSGVNCALNCFYQRGFHDASLVFGLLGEAESAREYGGKAEHLAEAIRREFWDDARGVFVDRLKADVPDSAPSVPANALALLYGVASDAQAPRALEWLVEAMLNNFRVPEPADNSDCNVTSYFAFYALGALYRHGKVLEAQRFIRTYWGRMLDRGAWTCWEYFVDRRGASRCHAWSSCPTHYLSTQVLGVTFPEPGNPDVVSVRPRPGSLQWARGEYPHPAGPIRVEWERKGGEILVDAAAPECVELSVVSADEGHERGR